MNTPAKPKVVRKYIMTPDFKPLFALGKDFGPTHGPLDRPVPTTINIIGQLLRQSGRDAVTIFEVKKVSDKTFTKPVQLTLNNYTLLYDDIVAGKTMPSEVQEPIDVHVNTVKATVVGGSRPKAVVRTLDDMVRTSDTLEAEKEPVVDTAPAAPEAINEPEAPAVETTEEVPEPIETTVEPEAESEPETEAPAEEDVEQIEQSAETPEVESEESEDEDSEDPVEVEETEVTEESTENSGENTGRKLTKAERKALRRAEREKMGGQ